jgi:hypothetical protein
MAAVPDRRRSELLPTCTENDRCQTRYIVLMRIGEPARRHGVTDSDIAHATRTAIRRVRMDGDLTMLIGPATDGSLLEIGVLDLDGEDPVVIHAMPLRPKFYRLLGGR